jgi:gas vesicle protein
MAQRERNERDRDDAYREGGSAADRLTYLLIGAGIGATVALLFAPKSGRELRGDLADASRKGVDYGRQGAQVVGQRATELYGTTASRAQELYGTTAQKAQDILAAGKEQISSRRDQLSAAIDAGREAYVEEKGRGAGAPALTPAPAAEKGGASAGGGWTSGGNSTGGGNA